MKTVKHITRDGATVPKDNRCVFAGCPLAGLQDLRCTKCTGPVVWPDANGDIHGCARSCSSCPMNGLGLPVCWAACPGPNMNFATDGKKMVTLGAMGDADGFLGRNGHTGRTPDMRQGGVVAERKDGKKEDSTLLLLTAKLLKLSGANWEAYKKAVEAKNAKMAAKIAGAPLGAFRGPDGGWDGSAAQVLSEKLGAFDAQNWEAIRRLATGEEQKRVADLTLVKKQAMNQRLDRLGKKHEWVARLREKK